MRSTLSATLAIVVFIINAMAQNFPPNGETSEEIALGGPSKDYLTLEFPREGVTQCAPFTGETRTVKGDIEKYGKALLVIIFPKDCPYCIQAADAAGPIIAKYRDNLTVWYANQRLNGDGSCADIDEMANKYAFIREADFRFIDIYMWNNEWNSPWHYGSQDSYWTRKESPSVYRIFSPKTMKVTGINYYVSGIETQIAAAIEENFTPGSTAIGTGPDRMKSPTFQNSESQDMALLMQLREGERISVITTTGRTLYSRTNAEEIADGSRRLAHGVYIATSSTGRAVPASFYFVRK